MTTPRDPAPLTSDPATSYDPAGPVVRITDLTLTDRAVVAEARRWRTGTRGPEAGDAELAGADLTPFVEQAVLVGAHALASAGGAQDTLDLQRLVADVERRTTESCERAAESTATVAVDAARTVEQASAAARKAITEAGRTVRQGFTADVTAAGKQLQQEMQRLVGGDDPELLARVKPLLDGFARDLAQRAERQSAELVELAAKRFDPEDPTSRSPGTPRSCAPSRPRSP